MKRIDTKFGLNVLVQKSSRKLEIKLIRLPIDLLQFFLTFQHITSKNEQESDSATKSPGTV